MYYYQDDEEDNEVIKDINKVMAIFMPKSGVQFFKEHFPLHGGERFEEIAIGTKSVQLMIHINNWSIPMDQIVAALRLGRIIRKETGEDVKYYENIASRPVGLQGRQQKRQYNNASSY